MKVQLWTSIGVTRKEAEDLFYVFSSWWGTSGGPTLVALSDNWFVIALDEDKAEGVWNRFTEALDGVKRQQQKGN